MLRAVIFLLCISLLSLPGCNQQDNDSQKISVTPADKNEVPEAQKTSAAPADKSGTSEQSPGNGNTVAEKNIVKQSDYQILQRKILYGNASLAEMRQAFTNRDMLGLCNTIHALFSMRWHRGALNILDAMWETNRGKYPEFSWDLIENTSARIAVASSLNRINPQNSDYLKYIRSQMDNDDDFNKAQVAVALGFNADPQDVPFLKTASEGNNAYVVQSAITGLALMNNVPARDALIELLGESRNTAKGELISNVLKQAYSWIPEETPVVNPDQQPQG